MTDIMKTYVTDVIHRYSATYDYDKDDIIAHAVIGIASEIDEFIEEYRNRDMSNNNMLLEAGDLLWYTIMLIDAIKPVDDLTTVLDYDIILNDEQRLVDTLIANNTKIIKFSKRHLYGRVYDVTNLAKVYVSCVDQCNIIAAIVDKPIEDILLLSKEKLDKRFL